MKKELKDKWIQALLSGEYLQTQGVLRGEDNGLNCYCALGVLCDVFDPNQWNLIGDGEDDPEEKLVSPFWMWGEYSGVLGWEARNKMGLDSVDHTVIHTMNDGEKTFKEIADWIEKNIEAI